MFNVPNIASNPLCLRQSEQEQQINNYIGRCNFVAVFELNYPQVTLSM